MRLSRLNADDTRSPLALGILSLSVGLFFGVVGGGVAQPWTAVFNALLLLLIFGAYYRVVRRQDGVVSGLVAGIILGTVAATIGLLLGGGAHNVVDGAIFGVLRGLIVGMIVGFLTRAQPHEEDRLITRLFLFMGSIGVGAVLGGAVGLAAGVMLGAINGVPDVGGMLIAALAGATIGGYLGSYYRKRRWILLGLFLGALVGLLSHWLDGALGGLVLGAITGSFAPMLWVAMIGAYGGLASRGPLAMVVEALEAPSEMLAQGVVPFLVPAVVIGMIVGTAVAGPGSLLVLPTSLALLGIMFGVLGEIDGHPDNRVTARVIIEMTMMGSEEWPVRDVLRQLTAKKSRREALVGAAVGGVAGLLGSGLGLLLGKWLAIQLSLLS